MSITNLADNIQNKNHTLDKQLIYKWNLVVPDLKDNYVNREVNISGVIAEKYRYDMYGLLKYLNVNDEFIYPTIVANGYKSSREYKADNLKIKILDATRLSFYLNKFTS